MSRSANAQYNLAKPDSLAIRLAARVRNDMYRMVAETFDFQPEDQVFDLGVTSDQTYTSSNYFEMFYPYKNKIVAGGIDDACFLEEMYPGLRFVYANALELPFQEQEFDYVHSSAVLEHVGSFENQRKMILECTRVARKGICLTTPNRWFPIEFHTQLPLAHWLPKSVFRTLLATMGQKELAKEENLNLMTEAEMKAAVKNISGWSFDFRNARLLGLKSNLVLFGRREA